MPTRKDTSIFILVILALVTLAGFASHGELASARHAAAQAPPLHWPTFSPPLTNVLQSGGSSCRAAFLAGLSTVEIARRLDLDRNRGKQARAHYCLEQC